ncbi:hypothetical protein HYALB_00011864 [Hymenoscyphus albidus]|uniref:Amidase domain-containing protein n=1 Tax=Hymenoscyphus albidus TaxID=595503 RepID=A0A9N9LPN8_9HELO|nr:hypothetical protein HYALB_00011864 [Hymenoscyphus albidus]
MSSPSWQDIAAAKQKERKDKIPLVWRIPPCVLPHSKIPNVQDWPKTSGFFTEKELEITESLAHEVVSKIATRQWTSQEVMEATCKRAAVAQQLLNCITEIRFERAILRAKELDAYLVREGKVIGPLHGLPISFKDQFNIKGVDTSVGYISWCDRAATEDSTLVTLLCNAGAIPYCKTNVPATLMMGESVHNVFGRTVNPRNRHLTTVVIRSTNPSHTLARRRRKAAKETLFWIRYT